ncbi:MAG: hypothetical protein K9M98_08460 [Cephaloticoccus sp.]|nr:hypothetical protein [Cephaloticoccus sp.]MCF7760522.1 hypothetical protein [Cephaloticoccus sp.]
MDKKTDHEFDIRFYESVLRRLSTYTEVIEILGGLYTKQGRIADGLRMDRKLVRILPENATAHYNLACSLALLQRTPAAMRSLRRAIELGYSDVDWMLQDPDLNDLKNHPEFESLVATVRAQG